MQNKNVVVLVLVSLFVSSCWYDPWRIERYVNVDTDDISFHDKFPDRIKFKDYYIGNSFILVNLARKCRDLKPDQGPYLVNIEIFNSSNVNGFIIINGIEVMSSLGKKYSLTDKNNYPIRLDFENISDYYYHQSTGFLYAKTIAEDALDLDFENKEIVTIIVDVKVVIDEEQTYKGKIVNKFVPVLKKGMFRFITV